MIDLTEKEYTMVELMAKRPGSVITKAAFISHLYNRSHEPEFKIVDVFICKIRNKIKKVLGKDEEYIHTSWGRGYVMERRSNNGSTTESARAESSTAKLEVKHVAAQQSVDVDKLADAHSAKSTEYTEETHTVKSSVA